LTAGKNICSACCGSKRGTEINCSPDCAYSPLSIKGYDLWLKTDANLSRKMMKDFYKKHYEKFIDEQIPALDNLTPRQAAKDPKMRPKLIGLMKQHLKSIDIQNKEKGLGLDISWMLDELGLVELK